MPRKAAAGSTTRASSSKKQAKKKDESDNDNSDCEVVEDINEDESTPSTAISSKVSKPTSKLFIVPKDIENKGWNTVTTFSLPHPRSGNPALFLVDFDEDDKMNEFLFEILTMEQPLRSWFIDDKVVSDGDLHVVTKFDPLFLLVPILKKSTQARPLMDHLEEHLPPQVADIICKRIRSEQLNNIATKKEVADLVAYVFNEEYTLSWLEKKVRKTATYLTSKNITKSENSISANFSFSSTVKRDVTDFLRYAADITSDYVDDDMKIKLFKKLGLPIVVEADKKRKADEESGSATKRSKTNGDVKPLEDYGSNSTPTNAAPKAKGRVDKELLKAAQKSQSLLNFFKPKPK